jgi:hypothetical protein
VEPITVAVGQRLAGRYRLEERVANGAEVEKWRAVDELLARQVGVAVLPADHDRATAVVEAAQLAATVGDSRFLRVLDAAEEDGLFYVVHEWVGGSTLAQILDAVGPLEPSDAHFMITEVAEAVTTAHVGGLAHLCVTPDTVIFGDNGQIKVSGLCVDAALEGVTADDPALADAQAIGKLLHAALTARWPDGPAYGLAAAIRTEGNLATPRQVRAGVPALLDEVVDRTLNSPPRHRLAPLTTPAAIAASLKTQSRLAAARRIQPEYRTDAGMPSSMTTTLPSMVAAGSVVPPPQGEAPPDWVPSRGMRTARAVVSVLLIAGLILLGALIARTLLNRSDASGNDDRPPPSSSPSGSSTPQALPIQAAAGFDPVAGCNTCDGNENNDSAAKLYDGDPGTAWTTKTYRDDPITSFKPGIGFVVDLGSTRQVRSLKVSMNTGHTDVALMASAASEIPAALDGFQRVADTTSNDGGTFTLTPKEGSVQARYLLVWYTRLPPVSGGYRAEVSDVTVQG